MAKPAIYQVIVAATITFNKANNEAITVCESDYYLCIATMDLCSLGVYMDSHLHVESFSNAIMYLASLISTISY